MKILLITSLPNAVLKALRMVDDVELHVVDCSSNIGTIGVRVSKITESISFDMILTYRCPYILPYDIFSKPVLGAYNIHPSLLPKYSGLNPWMDIMNDETQMNGVTLHKITSSVDNGDIIRQCAYSIAGMNYECARQKADDIAGEMIYEFINKNH